MNQLGLGVMINMLSGNESTVKAFMGAKGKVITELYLKSDTLHFTFVDGSRIRIYDGGQSCCESRYMVTDDDLSYYVGATLLDGEIAQSPDVEDGGECHEVQFLHIKTSKGTFTMSNHNEHNGYYVGFSIIVEGT